MNLKNTLLIVKNFPPTFWLIVGGTLLNQIGNMACMFLIPYLTQYLHFTLKKAAIAFALFGLGTLISSIVGGTLIDRFGPARVMILALFVNGMMLIQFSAIKHFPFILMMCIGWGLGYGIFRPAAKTLVSFLTPIEYHRVSFSIYRWAMNLGMSMGPAIGGFIAVKSFSSLFIINALANLLTCIFFVAGLFKSTWLTFRVSTEKKVELSLKRLKDPKLRIVLLGLLLIEIVYIQHESLLPIFLTNQLHFTLSFYGLLFTINTLIIVFCELPLNLLTFNWPAQYMFKLGGFFIAIGFGGLAFAVNKWHVIMLVIIWTLGEMILFPTSTAYVASIASEKNRGRYLALLDASAYLGLCIGPYLGGVVVSYFTMNTFWFFCGCLGFLAIFIFNFLGNYKQKSG